MEEILADQVPTIVLYYRRFYWLYDSTKYTPMNTWGGLIDGAPLYAEGASASGKRHRKRSGEVYPAKLAMLCYQYRVARENRKRGTHAAADSNGCRIA